MTALPSDSLPSASPEKLPGAFELLFYSLVLTKRYASDLYGFIAYLLFPMILLFGVQNIPGTLGTIVSALANVFFIFVLCWCIAAITTTVSLGSSHAKKTHDPRSIGMHATSVTGALVITLLLSGLMQLAGYVLLIIPGIILAVLFTFAREEVILRGAKPLDALTTSKNKVQQQFLAITWRLFTIMGSWIVVYTIGTLLILNIGAWATSTSTLSLLTTAPLWLDTLFDVLLIAMLPPLIVAHTVLYVAADPTIEPAPKESVPKKPEEEIKEQSSL